MNERIKFLEIPDQDKTAIFRKISNSVGMPAFAVEKDWWIV